MSFSPFPGPTASENNPPITPQYYAPNQFFITAIDYGAVTTVTTAETFYGVNNNYVIGQLVRFIIPFAYGASQLNNQTGYVVGLPELNQVSVNINTLQNYDVFDASPAYATTKPQLLPIGDVNTGTINADGRVNNGTFIPGAFIDISPSAGG